MLNNSHYIDKLRSSGLRPTKQRIKICEILFNTEKTFHFTINDLVKKISKATNDKISLATVYNTVHAFKKKGYLKEIPINSDQSYFDTNTSHHHHFYDADTDRLIDIPADRVPLADLPDAPNGHDIASVDVLIHITSKGG